MIRRLCLLLGLCLAPLAAHANGRLSPNQIASVGAHPDADARIPYDTHWVDRNGKPVLLGDLVKGKPTVLLFIDYTCRHICGPGLTLTAGALHDSGLKVGKDVSFVILGFNPGDGPAEARAMADKQLSALPDIQSAVHLLSADPDTIDKAERALGFKAVYDSTTNQYAHDASAYIFNAKGKLTKLLPETALVAPVLKKELYAAGGSDQKQGFLAHITTVCYGFAAAHGLYGKAIVIGLKTGGVLILLASVVFFLLMLRRRRRHAA